MMTKLVFKPKNIEVEAFRFGFDEPPLWFLEQSDRVHLYDNFCIINSVDGNMRCNHGDYIIKGITGEIYSCKDTVFQKTFQQIAI